MPFTLSQILLIAIMNVDFVVGTSKNLISGLSSPSDIIGDPVRKRTQGADKTGFPLTARGNGKASKVRFLDVPLS